MPLRRLHRLPVALVDELARIAHAYGGRPIHVANTLYVAACMVAAGELLDGDRPAWWAEAAMVALFMAVAVGAYAAVRHLDRLRRTELAFDYTDALAQMRRSACTAVWVLVAVNVVMWNDWPYGPVYMLAITATLADP